MNKSIALGLAGVAFAAVMLGFGFYSGQRAGQPAVAAVEAPAADAPAAAGDRAAIEKIVREYLVANPEVMVEVQASLEKKQEEKQRAAQQETISSSKDEIFNASYDGIGGNPNGSVTVVEFFDYNCGYCKRAFPDMEALSTEDKDLRVVYKEFPILGPDSQKAHQVSMAFRALMPEKWDQFHHTLMTSADRNGEDAAVKVALGLGADEAALRKEMENPAISKAFNTTYELANKLAITGTPSYVVGKEVIFGALGKAVLEEKVAVARSCTDATC
jgi:protein-disulfide isomerase